MKILIACVLASCAVLGCKKSDKDVEKELDKALAGLEKEMKADMAKHGGGGGAGGSEAELQLNKIGKHAKVSVIEQSQFPVGKVGPTPATDCCAAGGCKPDAAVWGDATWKALEFSIEETHQFQYSYESDGKTFTAKAIGCGDHAGTYTATGRIEAGNPVIQVSAP